MRRADRSVVMIAAVVMGSYRPLPEPPKFVSRAAKVAKTLKLRTPAKLYIYETLLERLPQDLEDMAAELGQFIQAEHAVMGQRHLARHRHVAPADQPHIGDGVMGARHGRVVTSVVRSPVRPATRWRLVVSMASARVIIGSMVVSRRASIDFPAPGGPSRSTFGSERLPHVQLHPSCYGCRGPTQVTLSGGGTRMMAKVMTTPRSTPLPPVGRRYQSPR
jgi:hypothetical protein